MLLTGRAIMRQSFPTVRMSILSDRFSQPGVLNMPRVWLPMMCGAW
jgi:hypothetical protein